MSDETVKPLVKDTVAVAAVLSPGVTAQVITGSGGVVLHLAVDRMSVPPQTLVLSGEETQVLVNMLLQFAAAQTQGESAQPESENSAES